MGKLTAVQVRNLREPGRYSDGEGLILKFFGSGRGSWIVRVQADGKRRDIGLGTLAEVGLADWTALGGLPIDVQPLGQWKLGIPEFMRFGPVPTDEIEAAPDVPVAAPEVGATDDNLTLCDLAALPPPDRQSRSYL